MELMMPVVSTGNAMPLKNPRTWYNEGIVNRLIQMHQCPMSCVFSWRLRMIMKWCLVKRLPNTYPLMRESFSHAVKYPFVHRLGLQSHLQKRYELSDKVKSCCIQWVLGVMACYSTFTVSNGCPTASPTAPMINNKEMWLLHIAITHYS